MPGGPLWARYPGIHDKPQLSPRPPPWAGDHTVITLITSLTSEDGAPAQGRAGPSAPSQSSAADQPEASQQPGPHPGDTHSVCIVYILFKDGVTVSQSWVYLS